MAPVLFLVGTLRRLRYDEYCTVPSRKLRKWLKPWCSKGVLHQHLSPFFPSHGSDSLEHTFSGHVYFTPPAASKRLWGR